jgi:hypothetical protein
MKLLLPAFFLFIGGLASQADNLLSSHQFESSSVGSACDVVNRANAEAIGGWRCFNVGIPGGATQRTVHFEVMQDLDTDDRYLAVQITANSAGDSTGAVGFDIALNPLPAMAQDHYTLKFRAKRLTEQPCNVLAILAGHATGVPSRENLVTQQDKTFAISRNFQTYTISNWVVPSGATQINVIFNLINYVSAGVPAQPCGVAFTDFDLEKTN